MRRTTWLAAALAVAAVVGSPASGASGCRPCGGLEVRSAVDGLAARPAVVTGAPTPAAAAVPRLAPPAPRPAPGPLAGRRIVIDPGHQLGNARFPAQINRPVPAGGFTKPCNTTGTATSGGYPEATFTWAVSQALQTQLEALGARVVLTRTSNSVDRWGPCVDARGLAGNPRNGHRGADLKISVHGDGSLAAGAHGFHVIYAPSRAPWTDDTSRASRLLALRTRAALEAAGFDRATYIAGGDGLDARTDLGTLNLSDVPTVVVELGNMRDPGDAATMTSPTGQRSYAAALVQAVRAHLGS